MAIKLKSSIAAAMAYYETTLQPPTVDQIAVCVELLSHRGFQRPAPTDSAGNEITAITDKVNHEWVEDLQEFPADLVLLACKRWRRSNVSRAPYASGELMESVREECVRRKCVYKNAEAVLQLIGEVK